MHDGKNGKEGQGNENAAETKGGRRCEGATVRTRRMYLSCFYRLARTSGPGYANDDEDEDEDGDDDYNDYDDDDDGRR